MVFGTFGLEKLSILFEGVTGKGGEFKGLRL